ncbi:hypothetical protein BT96DRAFT_956345 [Gymnopus androsaceus JB14]|uniref:ABC transporter family G domain-containing protein n=1 Tax=Gymnopus androsaceus JB14 TaxID=1447944 RepID=A0A6A4HV48_9AGAR|nr:hypothetical protein BT96DRAFT_956345 [Gymnopus androsaceus JB14]
MYNHLLRQPEDVPDVEKVWKCLDYCFSETNLSFFLLGLNVEQPKPKLLLFLDELTSGLDSHAILCTIHQPSALLFQGFDRLLFLVSGGRTVRFGEIGPNSRTLISYFESQGAKHFPPDQ